MEIAKEKLELAASMANHKQLLVMYEAIKSERDALAATINALKAANGKKFTAAMNIIGTDWHVTLCFSDCVKASKVKTTNQTGELVFKDVVYWEHCDLTVGLVSSELCDERNRYWESNGYKYELGYVPHATLAKGDKTKELSHLIGSVWSVGDEYCRTFDVGVKTTTQQHLAEIRAEAGRDGFLEGVRQMVDNEIGWFGHDADSCANHYANRVRFENK